MKKLRNGKISAAKQKIILFREKIHSVSLFLAALIFFIKKGSISASFYFLILIILIKNLAMLLFFNLTNIYLGDFMPTLYWVIIGITAIVAYIVLFKGFFVVNQQEISVIERFGRFNRIANAGLNIKIPFIEWVRGNVTLRICQLDVKVETKTKDNVFVKTMVSVQYRVKADKIFDAFYKLKMPEEQITSFVFDVVRAEVPKMNLDDVFEKKDSIANAVKMELTDTMQEFGYEIVKALVTDIDPDAKVKVAMNEINEQQRLRIAAQEKGEAEKILKVKQAEAEAESMRLQGEGVANQRKAIIQGLGQSIDEFQNTIHGTTAPDVMNMILMTQYYETLKEIGAKNKSTSILIPHTPGNLKDIAAQFRDGVIVGNLSSQKS